MTPFLESSGIADTPTLPELSDDVAQAWDAYQSSKYGYMAARLPFVIRAAQAATHQLTEDDQRCAFALLGLAYQATAVLLTKLGESDLAWIAAERGFTAAQRSGERIIIGSLLRSVVHALLTAGRFREAKQLAADGATYLQKGLGDASAEHLSVYGTCFLRTQSPPPETMIGTWYACF